MNEAFAAVLDDINRRLQSEFYEDFIAVEPCTQHSDVDVEEVNNSIIAHNIRVSEWQGFLQALIARADELTAFPTPENVAHFAAEARERAIQLPGLNLSIKPGGGGGGGGGRKFPR